MILGQARRTVSTNCWLPWHAHAIRMLQLVNALPVSPTICILLVCIVCTYGMWPVCTWGGPSHRGQAVLCGRLLSIVASSVVTTAMWSMSGTTTAPGTHASRVVCWPDWILSLRVPHDSIWSTALHEACRCQSLHLSHGMRHECWDRCKSATCRPGPALTSQCLST